jgi:hypothetical protein
MGPVMKNRFGACLILIVAPFAASAHHAVAGSYDQSRMLELEGQVTEVLWRNPHVQLSMRVEREAEVEVWELATTSLSNMRRWQIAADFIEVGDVIRVAGNPAVRGRHGLYVRHVLTAKGEEVLLAPDLERRWTDRVIAMAESRRRGVGDPSAPELGFFRVWSTPDHIPVLIPRGFGDISEVRANLTEPARRALDGFVWERDNPLTNCAPKGMPTIMEAPYPFEFVRDGADLLWHNEEFDTVRRIHMAPDATGDGQPASLLGYSVGRFEDERTLVVTTTAMGWGHFDGQGVPLGPAARAVERFALSRPGDRLDYTLTVSDPDTFLEAVVLEKHWVWYPDAVVGVYACATGAED